ncbi:TetR-like C-terminal domain-containing protein [Bacillus tuaregi]|uniref:TetR-like C-terminal domain-containing protein n=1 Tax=Bacillus tuaregi TaxID=1816695 RepID=UPI0028FCDF99|nr:TetR-like C-terminal domain-containing protein [Bacillus tuaregi]
MTEKLFEYFAEKKDVCQTLFNENGDLTFQKRAMDVAYQFIMKNWMEVNHLDEDVSGYLSTFIISGSIRVMKSWLDNGMDRSPKEMAELINSFINKGLSFVK